MAGPTNYSKISIGLPQSPEGVPQELFVPLFQVYAAIQNLRQFLATYTGADELAQDLWPQVTVDETLWPGNLRRWYTKQNEAINFGSVVSPILVGSEMRVRLANATDNTRPAVGICTSNDHTPGVGNFCEITIGDGFIASIAGMTPGQRYWLSTVSGVISNVPAVAAGNIEQYVGWAMAANRLVMSINGNFIQH